jgi:hypothetical protein
MSLVEDLLNRYREMDSVDRQNMYMAIAGIIVLIILLYTLGGVFDVFDAFLGTGKTVANQTMSSARNLSIIR